MPSNLDNTLSRITEIRQCLAGAGPASGTAPTDTARGQANITREGSPVQAANPSFETVLAQQIQQQASLSGLSALMGGDQYGGASFDTAGYYGGLGATGLTSLGASSAYGGLGTSLSSLAGYYGLLTSGLTSYGAQGSSTWLGTGAYGASLSNYRYDPFRDLEMTSPFGERPSISNPDEHEFHKGTDYSVAEGTPLPAIGSGVVTAVNSEAAGGLGRSVTYRLDTGEEITYGHLTDQMPIPVVVGQRVGPGLIVGISGNTGTSTGPHVHVEIRINGEAVDAHRYLSLLP